MPTTTLLSPITAFLKCETPQAWIDKAKQNENLPVLFTDHLICELNVNMCKLSVTSS